MAYGTFSRKLAAVLSVDAVGYSRLMQQDDVRTVQTIKKCREIISQQVFAHAGRVVDSPGDNLLAEFSSVIDAVKCALEIQSVLGVFNSAAPDTEKMHFRIGVNMGDIIFDEDRIYGDGINTAARLERLADGGGICISGSAYEQVKSKIEFGCSYLGRHEVKNIADPVPVYRIWPDDRGGECQVAEVREKQAARPRWMITGVAAMMVGIIAGGLWMVLSHRSPLPEDGSVAIMERNVAAEKPSIAVLPFVNLSEDKQQEYFSDGIASDLATDLSKFGQLIVAASTTAAEYKGKSEDIKEIGRQLGVGYILEGSVQKAGERVRINAQLIETDNGSHVWAERYDRLLKDLFEIQDEIIENIVRSLAFEISEAEHRRVLRKAAPDLAAYDLAMQAWHQNFKRTREGNRKARELFEKAIELDPNYAEAYVGLAENRLMAAVYTWTQFPVKALEEAYKYAKKAVEIEPSNAFAHATVGYIYMRAGEYDLAISELQRAIELNPNDWRSYRHLGAIMLYSGRTDEALKWYEISMRYDPYVSPGMLMNIGIGNYLKGEYDEALQWLEKGATLAPSFLGCHIILAATYAQMGRMDDAAREVAQIQRLAPFFEVELYGGAYRNPRDRSKIVAGLVKAGLQTLE
jgi:adenylate cyclase